MIRSPTDNVIPIDEDIQEGPGNRAYCGIASVVERVGCQSALSEVRSVATRVKPSSLVCIQICVDVVELIILVDADRVIEIFGNFAGPCEQIDIALSYSIRIIITIERTV